MSAKLEREIQRLLDAGESPSEALAEALENEPELQRAAVEMEQLDAVLGEWAAAPMDLDEDVFVRRISQRLDEQLSRLDHDPTLPPAFDDDDSQRRTEDEHSGEFELSALMERAAEPAAVAAAGFAQPPPQQAVQPQPAGTVVRLEPKRTSSSWVFAAAAVVGLVAAGGMFALSSGTPDAESSVAMVSEAETAGQTMPHDDYAPAPGSAALGAETERVLEMELDRAEVAAEESEEVVLAARGTAMRRRMMGSSMAYSTPTIVTEDIAQAPRHRMAETTSLETAADPAKTTVVRRTSARVFGCFESAPPSVRVRVWVDGRTGRVREVDVPSGGRPPEVECVRRAVRSARFPVREGVARYTTTLEYER